MVNPKEGRPHLQLKPRLMLYNGRSFPRETDKHVESPHVISSTSRESSTYTGLPLKPVMAAPAAAA